MGKIVRLADVLEKMQEIVDRINILEDDLASLYEDIGIMEKKLKDLEDRME
jgi:hypothetical protein